MAARQLSAAQPQQPGTAGKRILTAYFSKTGTTREAAQRIRSAAGGDLFEIRTVAAYPSDYQATVDQARRERDRGIRPDG